jgi:hypothetical protein
VAEKHTLYSSKKHTNSGMKKGDISHSNPMASKAAPFGEMKTAFSMGQNTIKIFMSWKIFLSEKPKVWSRNRR